MSATHYQLPQDISTTPAAAARTLMDCPFCTDTCTCKPDEAPLEAALPPDEPEDAETPKTTFTITLGAGRLHLHIEALGKYDRPYVSGFARGEGNVMGQLEESGRVHVGDIIIGLNGADLDGVSFQRVVRKLKRALPFQKTILFRRYDAPPLPTRRHRVSCGGMLGCGSSIYPIILLPLPTR